jgi:polar amino acid transport system permease protein
MTPRMVRLFIRSGVVLAMVLMLVAAVAFYPAEIRWGAAWEWRTRFLEGLGWTVAISAVGLLLALAAGTAAGVARVSASTVLQEVASSYVQVVRGTPFLVQVYVWYFCIAPLLGAQHLGGRYNWFFIGVTALGVFGGAYVAEIVRAGIESVPRGQWEAARSLGLSHTQTLRRVILPQALRTMIPPLTGEAVSLIKESSLLSVISAWELTYQAKGLSGKTYEGFAAYIPLAFLYLSLTLPLTLLTRRLERRLDGPQRFPVAEL